jgi:hypothetical protein
VFKFDPKQATSNLIPDGFYDAEVLTAEEQTSSKGNEMLKLTYRVWANGHTYQLFDYVVSPTGLWKLKGLAGALGLADLFAAGEIDPQTLVGKMFRAGVKTRADKSGKYPDSNVVTKYQPMASDSVAPSDSAKSDDDLSF